MSRARARWILGTTRLSLARSARTLVGRVGAHPRTANIVPRPHVERGTARMRLSHVLLSSDLNPRYLEYWPLAAEAWRAIADLEPVLVLVAQAHNVPDALRGDERVQVVDPVPGLHTALQAQCIRLLYPALLETGGGAVVTSDVDMVPLSAGYFHHHASRVGERQFLAYRSMLLDAHEIPICYNAALPAVWSEIFGVRTLDDARTKLAEWGAGVPYDGVPGSRGWTTDQLTLYEVLVERGRTHRDVWILDDRFAGNRRLNLELESPALVTDAIRRRLVHGRYTDFHLLHPRSQYESFNRSVVDLVTSS